MGSQQEHIISIFKEYTTPSRVLKSFTNLSNTVIQTALSGHGTFVFEILQNADDAFEDRDQEIEIQFILHDSYLIVHHNGKGFDYNDVERICDYASQIEEVKATDLSKTGYKGLGFKTLFNLSDCIYIYSNGYSFRFDKTYWSDSDLQSKPWQLIPIWCKYDELPLNNVYSYEQPVNFILKLNNINQLESQLRQVVDQPDLLLFLHRINKLVINVNREAYCLERKIEKFGVFHKVNLHKNRHLVSAWLLRTYDQDVPTDVKKVIEGASRFIYPDKIKKAKNVPFTFALQINEMVEKIVKVQGLCFCTLPMQFRLTIPYHINSFFILNLDRAQLHENEWNKFLLYQIGFLQLCLLRDLAQIPYLKNYVIEFLVPHISHSYVTFSKAFSEAFIEAKSKIAWLPSHHGLYLLKLGEAWTDETEFFKHSFQNIQNKEIFPYLIDYNVIGQNFLTEVKHFTYHNLFTDFSSKYYPQLTKESYIHFIIYLYNKSKAFLSNTLNELKKTPFLVGKYRTLIAPRNAMLEDSVNPIPDFLMLNPIDNDFLPLNDCSSIKDWLVLSGARRLVTPTEIIRESILKWIDNNILHLKINNENHIKIINYLATSIRDLQLYMYELNNLKNNLLVFTESNQFKLARLCYLPCAISNQELVGVISNDELISSLYCVDSLKEFFVDMGVQQKVKPLDSIRKSILKWIEKGEIQDKITVSNYSSIIKFIAEHYNSIESSLTNNEKAQLKKIPILTCAQEFQEAQLCYFDSAIPKVKGLEYIISQNELVSTQKVSDKVKKFFKKIGVSGAISAIEVIRRSVIRWIQEREINNKITVDNHTSILEYIAKHWYILKCLSGLKETEEEALKQIPILTKSGIFRAANMCYWATSDSCDKDIPGLESIISSDELVSADYYSMEEVIMLFQYLGVKKITFVDIYEKYINHLMTPVNLEWFFVNLTKYWEIYQSCASRNTLLEYLQRKFKSSAYLLGKNYKMYASTALYSSHFDNIHSVDPNSLPLLNYKGLPVDLEKWLGFKVELDLPCIMQLLEAVHKNQKPLGEKTLTFFSTLLNQLKSKDKHEIKKYELSLLTKENKLKHAKDLYYFIEEDSVCILESCYLKRIDGMSHKQTLELAQLCGVNILPFTEDVKIGTQTYSNILKDFYLNILPLITLQESKELNEHPNVILNKLYDKVCSIEFYLCSNIHIEYTFGIVEAKIHFNGFKVYVVEKWVKFEKDEIYDHLNKQLCLKTDVKKLISINPSTEEEKLDWLQYQKEDPQNFYSVEKELLKLQSKKPEEVDISSPVHRNIDQYYDPKEDEKYVEQSEILMNEGPIAAKEKLVPMVHENSPSCVTKDKENKAYGTVMNNRGTKAKNPHGNVATGCIVKDNMQIFPENDKQEWLTFQKDKFYFTDKSLQNTQSKEIEDKNILGNFELGKTDQFAQQNEENKYFKHSEIPQNKTLNVTESSSAEDSIFEYKSYGKQISCAIRSEENRVFGRFINKLEENPCCEATISPIHGKFGVNIKLLVQTKSEIDNKCTSEYNKKKRIYKIHSSHVSSIENHYTKSHFQENSSENCYKEWLNEKYISNLLQDHYKNIYPTSEYNLSENLFTLQWQPLHKIEIICLNENRTIECDLSLEKDSKVKEFITAETPEEDSVYMALDDCSYVQQISSTKKRKKNRTYDRFIDKSEANTYCDATSGAIPKSTIKININLGQTKSKIDRKYNITRKVPEILVSNFLSTEIKSPRIFRENSREEYKKQLDKKYVFTFVKGNCENKFPNSQNDLTRKVQGQTPHKIDIIWLNESKEREYDLSLGKYRKIDKLITAELSLEVDSLEVMKSSYVQQISPMIESRENRPYGRFMNESEPNSCYENAAGSIHKGAIEVDINLFETKSVIYSGYKEYNLKSLSEIHGDNFSPTKSFSAESRQTFQESSSEKHHKKWLSEKYVFTFLQNHYKNKYPNSQHNLSGGLFTIQGQLSHTIEIVWLNESKEVGYSYDLLLKKNGKIKQIIEVRSVNITGNESFDINHNELMEKVTRLSTEFPQHEEKYCIYCVFNVNNSPTTRVKELNNISAVCKVVLLEKPQI